VFAEKQARQAALLAGELPFSGLLKNAALALHQQIANEAR
jgi:hypothetical protein